MKRGRVKEMEAMMKRVQDFRRCWVLMALLMLCTPTLGGEWYRWRGPEQNGVSRETGLPESWSPEGENLAWSNTLGGMSSPIVMRGHIYTLARTGEEQTPGSLIPGPRTQEAVVCVDAATGKKVWEYRENITQTEVPFHRLGWSSVAGDPQTGRVYALLVHCTLICLDGKDGRVVWRRQLTEEFGMISTFGGRTPTPAVDEDQVFVGGVSFGWGDQARGQHRLYAFNKETGEINWVSATGGLPVDTPYNTPVFAVIGGQRLVITGAGDGGVHAFKSRTGEKVWSYKASKRGINASVVVDGTRVYVSHSEENMNSSVMGAVSCIDVADGTPKELWRADGVEVGFATPTIVDGRLYALDNKSTVFCLDALTGKQYWKRNTGTIGKASLVYGDGKLYVAEANGRMVILKPGPTRCEVLSRVDAVDILTAKTLAREYAIYGSVAIADGQVYLQTASGMFCIGKKKATQVASDEATERRSDEGKAGEAAFIQVRPADLVLRPGQSAKFTAYAFDAKGRALGQVKAEWSIGQVTIPPAPNAPATQPVRAGNLLGNVGGDGVFTATAGPHQGGTMVATVGNLKGEARVRVLPPLPWKFDFENGVTGKPPLTWLGAGGKFAVAEEEGSKALVKLTDLDLYYRARTNFGAVDMSNYTVQSDIKVGQKVIGGEKQMPDGGVINSRYVLVLLGSHQRLQIHAWPPTLPHSLNKTIPFEWQGDTWYTMKLRVEQHGDKAVALGKVWPRGQREPEQWTVTLEDPMPNRMGNPGLFGHSLVGAAKSLIHYDNILVTPNENN